MSTAVARAEMRSDARSELRQGLEAHLGADATQVQRLEDAAQQWAVIDKGLLVDIHIGHWRAEARMTLEDLGLNTLERPEYVAALQDLTALGTKYLLPRRVLQRIARCEQRGRTLVSRYSFNLRSGKFVPFTAYRAWKADNEQAREAFFAARDEVCDRLEQHRLDVLDGYVRIARSNFDQLRSRGVSMEMTRAAFVNRYVERIASAIPSAERIHGSFYWDVELTFIPMPSAIEQDLQRREEIRRQRQVEAAEAARVQEMNRDLAEHIHREKTEKIDGVLGHIQRQMLERMYEVTAELAGKVRNNPALSAAQVRSVRTMVGQLREMNFLGDESVEGRLERLESLLEAQRTEQSQATGDKREMTPQGFLQGIDALNDQIRQEASKLLSRRSVRAQMNIDVGGTDVAFGRRVSRLRRDLGDASIPVDFARKEVRRQVRDA